MILYNTKIPTPIPDHLIYDNSHCSHSGLSNISLSSLPSLNWQGWYRQTALVDTASLWFSAEYKSVWKHNLEETTPFIVIWESHKGGSVSKNVPLLSWYDLFLGSKLEIESYWVTCIIVVIISQKLRWKHTSSLGRFPQSSLLTR